MALHAGDRRQLVSQRSLSQIDFQQTVKFFREMHGHAGMNCPLAVEASMFAPNREDTFVPDVGMNVQPFVTCESEANEIFRVHIIARFSERRQKRLVHLRKKQLTSIRMIVRVPDQQ